MHDDQDSVAGAGEPRSSGSRPRSQGRLRLARSLIPGIATGLVVVTAVAAALMATWGEAPNAPEPVRVQPDAAPDHTGVVTAPPLKGPSETKALATARNADAASAKAMDTRAACRNCGVVQLVVAVHGYAQPQPSGYQMHIRMDDGTIRTVEQRGALAAGSRVIVERDTVRVLAQRPTQG